MRGTHRYCAALLAIGCTRTTHIDHAETAHWDDVGADAADTADTAELFVESTTGPTSTVCIPGEAAGFRLPSARWALSVLFASRTLQQPTHNALQLSPEWFIASAWQTGAFACGGYGTPWSTDSSVEAGGCYDLQHVTHWTELERLFPARFPSEGWPAWIAGDNPERATLALSHAVYAGHLLMRRVDGTDPDAWLADSEDPRASDTLAALFHVEGPWSATAAIAWHECPHDLADCATGPLRRHLDGLAAKQATLATADCFDAWISDVELDAFLASLADLWPHANWPLISAAAHAANTERFPESGLSIVHAVEESLASPLACPEATLWDHYRYSCY